MHIHMPRYETKSNTVSECVESSEKDTNQLNIEYGE